MYDYVFDDVKGLLNNGKMFGKSIKELVLCLTCRAARMPGKSVMKWLCYIKRMVKLIKIMKL